MKILVTVLLIVMCVNAFIWMYTKYKRECPYEGLECPNCQPYLRDYQIQLHMDTVWIYDGNRLVGRYTSDWSNQMDTILINDNQ